MIRILSDRINFDIILFVTAISISFMGLAVLYNTEYFNKQILWLVLAAVTYILFANANLSFIRNGRVLFLLFVLSIVSLIAVFLFGDVVKGAKSRFYFMGMAIQPADPIKLVLILILSKYLSRRHIEIKSVKHIFITAVYTGIPFLLIAAQPDLGSALMLGSIWFFIIILAGVSKKHLTIISILTLVFSMFAWNFVLHDYQKSRIKSFMHPLSDIQGSGYNAYQSVIAVGSGGLTGKGLGAGTQSRLNFLPEYHTDFVYAAFAEEWGFLGSLMLFVLYGIILLRILYLAVRSKDNMMYLYGIGLTALFFTHFSINIGMNIGLLPVTGITLPFMSYGGSHLLTEFAALGILTSFRRS